MTKKKIKQTINTNTTNSSTVSHDDITQRFAVITQDVEGAYIAAIDNREMDEVTCVNTVIQMFKNYGSELLLVSNEHQNNVFHLACKYGKFLLLKALTTDNSIVTLPDYIEHFRTILHKQNTNGNIPFGEGWECLSKSQQPTLFNFFTENVQLFNANLYLNDTPGYIVGIPDRSAIQGMSLLHLACQLDAKYKNTGDKKAALKDLPHVNRVIEYYVDVDLKAPSLNKNYYCKSPSSILDQHSKLLESRVSELHRNQGETSSDASISTYTDMMDDMFDDNITNINNTPNANELSQLNDIYNSTYTTNEGDHYVVAHFHGFPFFKSSFTHQERRKYGTSQKHLQKHLHSEVTYTNSNIPMNAPISDEQDVLLAKLAEAVGKSIMTIDDQSLHTAIQSYVNTFCASPNNFYDAIYPTIHRNLPDLVLSANPVVSTSKTPEHAFRFASTHFESDKTKVINPDYSTEGISKHRLIGIIFVTLHDITEYNAEYVADVTQLTKTTKIAPNAHYRHQLEVAFLGGVTKGTIVATIPVILPSLSQEHAESASNSPFYRHIFGESIFKQDGGLSKKSGTPESYRLKLEKGGDIAKSIIDKLETAYTTIAIQIASKKAQEMNAKLVYIDSEGKVAAYPQNGSSPRKVIDTQINDKDKYDSECKVDDKNWRHLPPCNLDNEFANSVIDGTDKAIITLEDKHLFDGDESGL